MYYVPGTVLITGKVAIKKKKNLNLRPPGSLHSLTHEIFFHLKPIQIIATIQFVYSSI